MMPILWEWEGVIIPAWHALFAWGAIAAYFLLMHVNSRVSQPLREEDLSQLFVVAYIGGYLGARGLSLMIEEDLFFWQARFWAGFLHLGPMTFYGGAVGGVAAGFLFCRWRRISLLRALDLGLIALMFALGWGRIGCFLNGDDFGIVVAYDASTAPWWTVNFPSLQEGVYRAPVQIWEAMWAFALSYAGYIVLTKSRAMAPGLCAGFLMVSYAWGRFVLEYFRGDPRGGSLWGILSPSQVISLLAMVIGLWLLRSLWEKRTE